MIPGALHHLQILHLQVLEVLRPPTSQASAPWFLESEMNKASPKRQMHQEFGSHEVTKVKDRSRLQRHLSPAEVPSEIVQGQPLVCQMPPPIRDLHFQSVFHDFIKSRCQDQGRRNHLHVLLYLVGKHSPGTMNVVELGPL